MTEKTSRPHIPAGGQPDGGFGPQSQSHELRFAASRPAAPVKPDKSGEGPNHD